MALKKTFSYQLKLFLPIVLCFWATVFGMFKWQNERIRTLRHEMVYDQLRVVAAMINENYLLKGSQEEYLKFMREFYRASDHYDPLAVRIVDVETGRPVLEVGERFNDNVFPDDSLGVFNNERVLSNGKVDRRRYIFYSAYTPDHAQKMYIVLPYTKQLANDINSRNLTFWLIFIALGIFVTMLTAITSNYFARNLNILRRFAHDAAEGKIIDEGRYTDFPQDELGDISRQILLLYNNIRSETAQREHEHQVALNAIDEKNRIKRELTGNISHELKTPVSVVKGYIDILCDNPDMDADRRTTYLYKAQAGVDRLTELMKDITAITKLESGGKLVDVSEVNFHDFVFSFANYVEESAVMPEKMKFYMEMPMNLMVLANESLLQASLLNLVKNAALYSEGTEIHLNYVKEDDDFYYFRFYDNGVGVPPEHLPHMFERFYRVNSGRARTTGGTGLGLAIVEITIQSFGGSIQVLNHFPTGLEYNFTLMKYSAFMKRRKVANTSEPQSPPVPLNE